MKADYGIVIVVDISTEKIAWIPFSIESQGELLSFVEVLLWSSLKMTVIRFKWSITSCNTLFSEQLLRVDEMNANFSLEFELMMSFVKRV